MTEPDWNDPDHSDADPLLEDPVDVALYNILELHTEPPFDLAAWCAGDEKRLAQFGISVKAVVTPLSEDVVRRVTMEDHQLRSVITTLGNGCTQIVFTNVNTGQSMAEDVWCEEDALCSVLGMMQVGLIGCDDCDWNRVCSPANDAWHAERDEVNKKYMRKYSGLNGMEDILQLDRHAQRRRG